MEASSLKDAKILKTKHIWLFHSQKVAIQAQKLPQFILFIQPHHQFGRSQKQHDHSQQLHVRMSMSTSSTAAFPHLPEDDSFCHIYGELHMGHRRYDLKYFLLGLDCGGDGQPKT